MPTRETGMAGPDVQPDVVAEQALAVQRIVQMFALAAMALVGILLPLTFVEGLGAGLPDGVRTAAGLGLMVGHGLAARARWADLIQTRRGRLLLDLYPFVLLVALVPLPIIHGGNQPVFWGVALLLGFAALFTSRGMFVTLMTITVIMHAGTFVRFGADLDVIGSLSALGSTLFLAVLTRLAGRRFQDAVRDASHLRMEAESHAARLRAVARGARAVSAAETPDVLQAVAEATADLGWDLCALVVPDDDGGFRMGGHRGLPHDPTARAFDADDGAIGAVLSADDTVVADGGGHFDGTVLEPGLQTVAGTPIRVHGDVQGVIVVGSRAHRTVSAGDVEALELLAAQAGRAMELARQHELQARTIEELTELDRLKRDFVSTVSHEIRTPITVILGMAETVDERWDGLDDERRLQLLRRLRRNASGLETVISNLLDFAKLERGHVEASPAAVDVGGLVREVVARLETLLRDHEVDVHTDAGVVAMADGALIERVVENLVVNATRHTPAGTDIAVAVAREHDQVVVSVTDNGPGISATDLRRLGERFFRGGNPTTRPTRGVGLGLAFCKQILELHGSELEILSTPGIGTTFRFHLAAAVSAPKDSVA